MLKVYSKRQKVIKQGHADVTVNDKLAVLDYLKQKGDDLKIVAESDEIIRNGLYV